MKTSQIHLASTNDCTACAACVSVCPKGCITMQEDREGFLQPKIDTTLCIECHKCEKVCPILNPIAIPQDFETKAYAAINRDDEVRAQSSSGGVFFPLAKWVIDQGGVVFGARWNEKWEVIHDYAEDIEGVKAFMKSKYVQSVVGDTLKQAKSFLEAGRWVLYSGTPCQIGGLKAYLGKEYDKLVTVDLICHGVPSPGVWRGYLKDYFGKEKIVGINFRDKKEGWIGFQCVINTDNKEIREEQMENPYFSGFLKNVYLRNGCYNCHYRTSHRSSDITLADYWGVNSLYSKFFDDKGTTLFLIHTEKGKLVTQCILPEINIIEQDIEKACLWNISLIKDYIRPKKRDLFFCFNKLLGFKYSKKIIDFIINITKIKKIVKKCGMKYFK